MIIPDYMKHMEDLELRNEIDQARYVLDECVEYARKIAKDEEADLENLEGLFFASLRYNQLVEEMDRRFADLKGHAKV